MTDPIAALRNLASALADDIQALWTAKANETPPVTAAVTQPLLPTPKTPEPPRVVLVRTLANLESLVAQVRSNPNLSRAAATSTLENLEAQYGNTLGRIIAALGGLPMSNLARSDSLMRLLASDPAARAELSHIDPNDSELLEVLFELFVSAPRPSPRKPTTPGQRGVFGVFGAATEVGAERNTDHLAELVAERAQYVIPAIIPPAPTPDEVIEDDDEHPVEPVRRVEAIHKAKRQK